jgi:hypothetical protein
MRLIHLLFLLAGLEVTGQTGSWTPLFNGRDLTGWKQLNGQAKFEVVKGEIRGTTVPNTPNSKDFWRFYTGTRILGRFHDEFGHSIPV